MPLRDHFRPPLDNKHSWDELHGGWPMVIVQQLRKRLPAGYIAGPRVHLGIHAEIDIATFSEDGALPFNRSDENGGIATAVWCSAPTLVIETTQPDFDEYEVRIYDEQRGRRLVAAIEIVGPANKDRPESRNFFVAKCAALLQQGVAVSIVDLVTIRQFSLYAELLAFVGQTDPMLGDRPPHIYAATCRWITLEKTARLQIWSDVLTLGQSLPTLPLWLSEKLVVPLDLERSYEQACNDLWIA